MNQLCLRVFAISWLASSYASAANGSFDAAIDVTAAQGKHVFHHLESAGRKNVVAQDGLVAVTWEDNRDGAPRCYFTAKTASGAAFLKDVQISGKDDCYEPSITALGAQKFAVAWEENGRVLVRLIALSGENIAQGEATALSDKESSQASLGSEGDSLYAAWAEKEGHYSRIHIARLAANKSELQINQRALPDATPLKDDQLYPSIAPGPNGEVAVAWEDRRNGHTLILHAFSSDGKKFEPWHQVNETQNVVAPATTSSNRTLGRGPGAMRAALARRDDKRLTITWLDKRDFLSGYDVYAAFSDNGGRTFGPNQKVQDSFGDTFAQWHTAIAAHGDRLVAAWDDDRDGTADVWISWQEGNAWADNIAPKPASGPGAQSDPSIAIDEHGDLHLIWVDRQETDGPTRLRYVRGQK